MPKSVIKIDVNGGNTELPNRRISYVEFCGKFDIKNIGLQMYMILGHEESILEHNFKYDGNEHYMAKIKDADLEYLYYKKWFIVKLEKPEEKVVKKMREYFRLCEELGSFPVLVLKPTEDSEHESCMKNMIYEIIEGMDQIECWE